MGDYSDAKQIDRIMSCPAGQAKMENIRKIFKGKTITEVSFSNRICAIGIHLRLDDEYEAFILREDLGLDTLLEDETIHAQEQALKYQEYPDRRPKTDSPPATTNNASRTRTIHPVHWHLCRCFGFLEAWDGWKNPCLDLSWVETGGPAPTLEETGSPVYFEDENAVVCCDAESIFISPHDPAETIYTKWESTTTREEAIEKLKALPEDYFERREELGFNPE